VSYKVIFRDKALRLRLLRLLSFVPDKWMIIMQYFVKTGRLPNLENPVRYTEKIQWYKLHYRTPLITKCSDKIAVREFVEAKGLGAILTQCYSITRQVDTINFDELPKSFAIKFNNGSGVNVFVADKSKADEKHIKNSLKAAIDNSHAESGREWGYYGVSPGILIEELLPRDRNNDIPDYKFFCFSGRVEYLYVMRNYVDNHDQGECSFFTRQFEKLPYSRSEYKPIAAHVDKPKNFNEMIRIAEILAKDFPHVRVDLYNVEGVIYFGELTFYPASGYTKFEPDDFDSIMGKKFQLPYRSSDMTVH
jgi:teichuronopeptide biosynthesis TupA-like protein